MVSHTFRRVSGVFLLAFLLLFASVPAFAQGFDSIERARMKSMLKSVKNSIKKYYYDPAYRGIDLDERFARAEKRLDEVKSTDQALGVIAQATIDFNDSHLLFIPPSTNLQVEYGWRMRMIGDKCYIVGVKPGSDAEKKGVKVGDQLIAIDGFRLNRKELWKLSYYYNMISKRSQMKLALAAPGAETAREVVVQSEMKKQPARITLQTRFRLFDDFYEEKNDDNRFVSFSGVTVWKFPSFSVDPKFVDQLLEKPRSTPTIVIDLRGNGGGYVKSLERLVANVFDKDVHIAELKGRKKMDPMFAKTTGSGAYKGKIIVLVDSESGSAAELFARVIQLEKRGVVLGDVSAGAVMQSQVESFEMGTDSVVPFGINVTNADVIMSDGKSLEHVGVQPDELILTTAEQLAAGIDPVMTRALEIAGVKVDPKEAGKFFPYFWKMN